MQKEQIIDLLKHVQYPGFSRDIVSFGMVETVEVESDQNTVDVTLKISTQQEAKKKEIINSVRETLTNNGKFKTVNIQVKEEAPSVQTPQSDEPTTSIYGNVQHVIAVASGKGGVGKSTVAANIACALQAQGLQTGLLDLDIYGPSLPVLLGINEQPQITAEKKLIPMERFDMKVMSFGFISGNDTPVIWRGPLVSRMTEQFFKDVEWGDLDVLVLDLPPGTGDVQLTLTQKIPLDGAVIVTTPQDIALADVRKGADMFRKVKAPVLGVVENMAGLHLSGKVADAEGNPIPNARLEIAGLNAKTADSDGEFDLTLNLFKSGGGSRESQRLGVPLLGSIPLSPDIVEATDAGVPLVEKDPDSTISSLYRDIARQLTETLTLKQSE